MHKVDGMPLRELLNEITELEARGPESALDGLYLAILKAERNLKAAKEHNTKKSRIETLKLRKKQAIHEYDAVRWDGLHRLL